MHSLVVATCASPVLLATLLCASMGAIAQSTSGELDTVVVTATRTLVSLNDVLADVSVVDAETIARSGAVSLADVLVHLPGIEMTRNGGPLGTTNLFLRGGNTNHTVVMIDGIRIDTQSGSGGATCQAIPASQIDRIEVLRGPAAAVYGSDAVAGVIQVFTKVGEGGFTPSLGLGVASQGTRTVTAGVRGAQEGWRYALAVGRELSAGYNIQPAANPDKDDYARHIASLRIGKDLVAGHQLNATWVYSNADAGYDSTTNKSNPNYAKDNRTQQRLSALGVNWQAKWSDAWSTQLALTRADDRYATLPAPGAEPSYDTKTQIETALLQSTWSGRNMNATVALERRDDRLRNAGTQPRDTRRSQDALALGYAHQLGTHRWQVNARLDDDSEFGRYTTGALAYGWAFAPDWRLTASAGTAFRVPTLYQRFSEYGFAGLAPEKAFNREVGLKFVHQGHAFSAVAYLNQVSNLISFAGPGACVSTFGCYANTARAKLQGVTLSGVTHTANVVWSASLDLQDPVDATTGKRLARRAQRLLKLGAETAWQDWSLKADVLLSSDRYDRATDARPLLPGYGLLNLSATKALAPEWTLLLRVDNLGDKYYETARGYATPGRTVFAGLTWTGR